MKTPTRTAKSTCLLIWGLVATLLSQNVFSSSLQDQKNFYFPPFPSILSPPIVVSPPTDPSTPPIAYYGSPPPPTHGSGGSPPPVHNTPPSHGGGGGGGGHHHGGSPPHHGGSPPHHGGSPPTNCGNPSPPKHGDPSPGGHHNPSPSVPTYHHSPPPSGGGGVSGSPPSYPIFPPIVLPPITPGLPFPSPPFDPNSPPITGGPCDFWRNHPTFIWGLFGWGGPTIGSAFGVGTLPGAGANLNLLQALSNTRTDGIGALYREGTASLLNSMVNTHFPYTTNHVKTSFMAAIGSNKAAAAQARVFKLANEGHMKLRA